MNTELLAQKVYELIEEKKGEKLTIINLKDKQVFTDFIIIATASSNRMLVSMAEYIHTFLKKEEKISSSIEGLPSSDWVLLDIGSVVVHLFKPEAREYYQLEKMWENFNLLSAN